MLADFTDPVTAPIYNCVIQRIQLLEEKAYPIIQPHPFLSDGSVYNSCAQAREFSLLKQV